jgi:hypothetical protein
MQPSDGTPANLTDLRDLCFVARMDSDKPQLSTVNLNLQRRRNAQQTRILLHL